MGLMGLALLPLTVLAYVQTARTQSMSDSRAEAAILGDTLSAAAPMDRGIMRARGAAQSLAAIVAGLPPEACSTALARFVQGSGFYSFAGYTQANGIMECSSKGTRQDFSASERFRGLMAGGVPRISAIPAAKMSGTAVLTLTEPVKAGDQLLGMVSLSIPQDVLRHQVDDTAAALIVLDAAGNVLTSTLALDQTPARLPQNWQPSALSGDSGQSFVGRAADGKQSAFALVPIAAGEIYLLGSWPVDRLDADVPTPVFPALIWAASLLVVWIAAETQVLRHVRLLRGAITAFAAGDRRLQPLDLRAPTELAQMGRAFQSMALAVTQGEAELENTIRQKQILLREVHHRVMNNLQLIASILNMQGRTTQSPETKAAMNSIKERVLSLATIHRELYVTAGQAEVQLAELLPQILRNHLKLATVPGRVYDLDFRIDDIRLAPEQAVPLALWLTEGMANVIRHGAAKGGRVAVGLSLLRQPDGTARLVLENPVTGPEGAAGALGGQLLAAFAQQFGGEMARGREGETWRLSVTFPIAQA